MRRVSGDQDSRRVRLSSIGPLSLNSLCRGSAAPFTMSLATAGSMRVSSITMTIPAGQGKALLVSCGQQMALKTSASSVHKHDHRLFGCLLMQSEMMLPTRYGYGSRRWQKYSQHLLQPYLLCAALPQLLDSLMMIGAALEKWVLYLECLACRFGNTPGDQLM